MPALKAPRRAYAAAPSAWSSAPPSSRPAGRGPGLLGLSWDVGGGDDRASTSTTDHGARAVCVHPRA
jgi:hypothetical protein